MNQTASSDFRIRDRLVQPRLNRIAGAQESTQVEPKIMQVLVCLAERPGEVVTRKALLETVWADTVVGDEVVSRSISELRKVFGDSARKPHVIETIPKSGYRLIAPVLPPSHSGDQLPVVEVGSFVARQAPERLHEKPRRPLLRRYGLAALFLVLVAVGIAGFLHFGATTPRVLMRTVPLTSFQGAEFHPALSPDANQVAFIWSGPDNGPLNVFVKMVDDETPLQLTDDVFYEFSPAWAPDGSRIAFARSLHGLFVIPALGGPERKLTDFEDPTGRPDVSWSPTGTVIAFTDRTSAETPYRIILLDLDTLEKQVLTTPPDLYAGDSDPVFSPDGRMIAFIRTTDQAGDLYVVPLAGGEPRRLSQDQADIAGVDWTPDGHHLIFSSNRGGTFSLWRIEAEGGVPEPLGLGSGDDLKEPTLRGHRLAYAQSSTEVNIWRVSVDGKQPEAVISSTRRDAHPQFSPDGTHVAFTSSRAGSIEIWMSRVDGSEPVRLTSFGGPYVSNPRWSNDGQRLAFDGRAEGQADLYVIDVAGGLPRRVTTHPAADIAPTWSNDDQWLYFASKRSSTWQIWKIPAGGGEAVQVTRHGGILGQEAPDGQTLYYTRADTLGLWQTASSSGLETLLVDALHPARWGQWAIRGEHVYFIGGTNKGSAIYRFNPQHDLIDSVAALPQAPLWNQAAFTVSPDEATFLYARVDHSQHDLMLVDDFR